MVARGVVEHLPAGLTLMAAILIMCLLHTPASQAQSSANTSATNNHKRLVRADHCPGKVITWPSRYRRFPARSVVECLAYCGPDVRCLSIVYDASSRECYHSDDIARLDCSNMEDGRQGLRFFETKVTCEKREEEPGPGGVCVCADGYRGDPCVTYIGDCDEGYTKGNFSGNGVFSIYPRLSASPFSVYCKQMTNNVRIYIMERRSNTLSFNRTYAEYQAGFGNVSGDHWLGLDKVYELTNSKTYELRVTAKLHNGTSFFMQYQQFNISSSADGYRLWFNLSFTDTFLLGDCFTPLWKAQFSARDHDRDEDETVNCATKHGGGWWFRGENCSTCNPTGPLLKPSSGFRTGVDAEAFWTENMGDLALYKMTMYLVNMG